MRSTTITRRAAVSTAPVAIFLALVALLGQLVLTGSAVAAANGSAWKAIGGDIRIDVPPGFGSYRDVDRSRYGTQVLVQLLRNGTEHRVRIAAMDGSVIGEGADGGFTPQDSLGAGLRAFGWGLGSGGRARMWTPAFDASRTLLSVDPALPCGRARDAQTPLAGPFPVALPAGARPGGRTVTSPTTASIYGDLVVPGLGVRILTVGGSVLGQRWLLALARGGFGFANAIFAYGADGLGHPMLWTPELEGSSTELVGTGFTGCTAVPATGTVRVTTALVPATDPGRFDLRIDGATRAAGVGDAGTTGSVTVAAGAHMVDEVAAAGTSLADYDTSISCTRPGLGSPVTASGTSLSGLQVAAGHDWACTITNTRKAVPPFDGTITPSVDSSAAVSREIGPDGGSITAAGITLTVPSGALPSPTTITLTPLTSLGPTSPLGPVIGGVDLAPQGLQFIKPATLAIPVPAGTDLSNAVAFGYEGAGAEFHLAPAQLGTGVLVLSIPHFTAGGGASATPAQVAAALAHQPSSAEAAALQSIAAANALAAQNGSDPTPAIDAALDAWYPTAVRGLSNPVPNDLTSFEAAVGPWQAWVSEVQTWNRDGAHQAEINSATDLATTAAAHLADLGLSACDGSGAYPYQAAQPLVSLAHDILLLSLDIETKMTHDGKPEPSGDELSASCLHAHIVAVHHPTAFAFEHGNTITVDAEVKFWAGASRSDVPISVHFHDNTHGLNDLGTVAASGGSASLLVQARTKEHRYVDVIAFPQGLDFLQFSSTQSFDLDVLDRIDLQSDQTLQPGDSAPLTVHLAGDGVAGATVSFSNAGAGSVYPTSDVADANGTVTFSYYAASDPAGGTDTVKATFDDGSGPVSDSVTITVKPRITVDASPAFANVNSGQTQQYTATVTGYTTDGSVTWTATGGTIDQNGLFTAGNVSGTFHVTATSNEDPTKQAAATVVVHGPRVSIASCILVQADGALDPAVAYFHDDHNQICTSTSTSDLAHGQASGQYYDDFGAGTGMISASATADTTVQGSGTTVAHVTAHATVSANADGTSTGTFGIGTASSGAAATLDISVSISGMAMRVTLTVTSSGPPPCLTKSSGGTCLIGPGGGTAVLNPGDYHLSTGAGVSAYSGPGGQTSATASATVTIDVALP